MTVFYGWFDNGEIPFHYVGTHRRITMSDVVSYKQNRKIKAKAALRQMTELSEEMELYDD